MANWRTGRRGLDEEVLGDPCQEEEEEFEEDSEELEGEESNASESDPADLDLSDSIDPGPEDPNVDVEVDTETDAEVDAEIESEVETGSDVEIAADELFFDADLETEERPGIDYVSGDPSED